MTTVDAGPGEAVKLKEFVELHKEFKKLITNPMLTLEEQQTLVLEFAEKHKNAISITAEGYYDLLLPHQKLNLPLRE